MLTLPSLASDPFYPWSKSVDRDPWSAAFDLWLASRPSEHTRRAYRKSWQLFHDFTRKPPAAVGRAEVAAWIDTLRSQGLSPETIHQRLAALSSFYTFVTRTFTTVDSAGREQPLHAFNPAAAVPHPKTNPYGKARCLSAAEARALLHAIPHDTLQGQRDLALFLAYLATGRRNSEIRLLRWGDFEVSQASTFNLQPAAVFYRWTGKGKHRRDHCPLPVWQAIQSFLRSAGRLRTDGSPSIIQPADYIFTPLNDHANRLPNASPSIREISAQNPLSARMVDRLVKKYARLAGLDPARITVHTLRHTAAMLRKKAGDDLEAISTFLGHATLATTQIYLHSVEERQDTNWIKVADLLGLNDLPPTAPGFNPVTSPTRRLPKRSYRKGSR